MKSLIRVNPMLHDEVKKLAKDEDRTMVMIVTRAIKLYSEKQQ